MDKKKRAPNFTNEEKQNLLNFVAKYKDLIECKKSGAVYIARKREAWKLIARDFNSVSTSGTRHEDMLKHFYNNIKHRARKASASDNKQKYLLNFQQETITTDAGTNIDNEPELVLPCTSTSLLVTQNEVIQYPISENYNPIPSTDNNLEAMDTEKNIICLKKKFAEEKKNIKKTGGGAYVPRLTDADHQILSILDNQIRPDQNPYDDAAEYFGETTEIKRISNEVKENTVPKSKKKKKSQETQNIHNSVETLKKIYFKKNIELVNYQKKNEMLKYRFELNKQALELKILNKTLEKL